MPSKALNKHHFSVGWAEQQAVAGVVDQAREEDSRQALRNASAFAALFDPSSGDVFRVKGARSVWLARARNPTKRISAKENITPFKSIFLS
jgi:hypothetical protein